MLRRLYRCAVRLHPSVFRQRFGEEMLYIFDQQKGTPAAVGVLLDCVLSLLRQWALRPQIGTELAASSLRSAAADHIPLFESLDPFQPRASAIIQGALLSLMLFYMTVFAVPYSWSHVLNLRFPDTAGDSTQSFNRGSRQSTERVQVDVIPTESEGFQKNTIASPVARTPAVPIRTHAVTIWLDPYVGTYISDHPPASISIQIEGDLIGGPRGDHLSLLLAAAGHSSFVLSPVSQTKFVIVGAEHSYVEFTADTQGRICCLSLVVNGNTITAQRQ